MKTKIIGILVCMLLIATAIPVIGISENESKSISSTFTGININEFEPQDVPPAWLEGADQYQTDDCKSGMVITPLYRVAQEFKPTEEDLTAVALQFFNYNDSATSDINIIVSIRESLDGVDLTTKTINADDKNIRKKGKWVMFDFDDITVIPEETYYIVCYASDGVLYKSYCWLFDVDNKYDRGIAWASDDSGETWYDLEDVWGNPEFLELDLCFITYFEEPPDNKAINSPFLQLLQNFFEKFPNAFPLLRQVLGL
jgi:hypothetical protein